MFYKGILEVLIKKKWEKRYVTQKDTNLQFSVGNYTTKPIDVVDICNVYKIKKKEPKKRSTSKIFGKLFF